MCDMQVVSVQYLQAFTSQVFLKTTPHVVLHFLNTD